MLCIRGNQISKSNDSLERSPSIESLNNYLNRNSSRNSVLRRSFDLARKSFVHCNQKISQFISNSNDKNYHIFDRNIDRIDDKNNTNNFVSNDGVTYIERGLALSTDCGIVNLNENEYRLKCHQKR